MWEISGNACRALIVSAIVVVTYHNQVWANDTNFYQSNTQFGVNLPNATLPSGSDEVRAADGTTCKSAVGGNGAYLDSGVIGSPGGNGLGESGAIYSRIVIPLGETPRRLDCGALYELEVQRLRAELQLARMGLAEHGQTTIPSSKILENESWSTEGIHPVQTAEPKKAKKIAAKIAPVQSIMPVADTINVITLKAGETIY